MKNKQRAHAWLIEPKAVPSAIVGLIVVLAMAGCASGSTSGVDRSGNELLAALNTGLRPTVFAPDAAPPGWSLQERMAHYKVPGVAVAVLTDGRVVGPFNWCGSGIVIHDKWLSPLVQVNRDSARVGGCLLAAAS